MSHESKTTVYNRMMSTRGELRPEFVEKASAAIQNKVLLMEEFHTAFRVGLYAPFGNEVRTETIFTEGDRQRKAFYYPALDPSVGDVAYYRVADLEELRPLENGTRAPSRKQSRLRDLNTLAALIVPGVAFDLQGSRMGFGKGFYDDSLANFRGKRIALAYDFQVVSGLPLAVRGRKVDWIVTEKRIIRC